MIEAQYKSVLKKDYDWCWAWSGDSVMKSTAPFFKGCKTVLDIGSGVGKFCLLSAAYNPDTLFVGVEIGKEYYDEAIRIKKYFGIKNVEFINADFRSLDLNNYEGFYIFNPFPMTIPYEERKKCVIAFRDGLAKTKSGTKLVMLNQFCEEPKGFKISDDVWPKEHTSSGNFYIKK